jgi:hypothetical protein
VFVDPATDLVRPWPGLAPSVLWTAWVAQNLRSASAALASDPSLAETATACRNLVARLDGALTRQGLGPDALGGDDVGHGGLDTVPVEVDGEVVWRVATDDVVQRFVMDGLLPVLEGGEREGELAYGRALDTFRFLRAFERTGLLQVLTQTARGLWLAGPERRADFDRLFAVIARGFIFAQEPGMIQGPALLGGVYSTPMALVRFLELTALTATGAPATGASALVTPAGRREAAFGDRLEGAAGTTLLLPAGAVARIDRAGEVSLMDAPKPAFATVTVDDETLAVAAESRVTVELAADKDPLEYVAIVAVPTTTAIRQTEDVLSDYKGQLIYGQQTTGGSKLQVVAVPFRGSRTMRLWIEGLYPGRSPGFVAIRHLSNPADACSVPIPAITVE